MILRNPSLLKSSKTAAIARTLANVVAVIAEAEAVAGDVVMTDAVAAVVAVKEEAAVAEVVEDLTKAAVAVMIIAVHNVRTFLLLKGLKFTSCRARKASTSLLRK